MIDEFLSEMYSVGDRILSVNGLDCDELDYDQVIDQIRRIPRDVELFVLHRPDAAKWAASPKNSSATLTALESFRIWKKTQNGSFVYLFFFFFFCTATIRYPARFLRPMYGTTKSPWKEPAHTHTHSTFVCSSITHDNHVPTVSKPYSDFLNICEMFSFWCKKEWKNKNYFI